MFNEELLLQALFVYIIARVVTKEVITSPWREWLLSRDNFWLHELFSCPFCMSFWVSCFFCFCVGSPVWPGYRITFYMLITSMLDTLLERKT